MGLSTRHASFSPDRAELFGRAVIVGKHLAVEPAPAVVKRLEATAPPGVTQVEAARALCADPELGQPSALAGRRGLRHSRAGRGLGEKQWLYWACTAGRCQFGLTAAERGTLTAQNYCTPTWRPARRHTATRQWQGRRAMGFPSRELGRGDGGHCAKPMILCGRVPAVAARGGKPQR